MYFFSLRPGLKSSDGLYWSGLKAPNLSRFRSANLSKTTSVQVQVWLHVLHTGVISRAVKGFLSIADGKQ